MDRLVAALLIACAGCAVSNEPLSGHRDDAATGWDAAISADTGGAITSDASDASNEADSNTAPTGGSSGEQAGTGGVSGSGGVAAGTGGAGGVGGAAGTGGDGGEAGTGGTAPTCECSGVNDCCDGCNALNPCDYMLTDSQCQAAICNPVTGCTLVPVARQGLSCDDGDANTNVDRCDQGRCVGRTCECTTGPCCDGCHLMPREQPSGHADGEGPNLNYCGTVTRFACAQGHETETVIATYCSGTSPLCDGASQSIGATATPCGHDCRTPERCEAP